MSSSEALHSTADDSDATDARFSLRALLKATAAFAVLATLLAPLLRQFDPDQQRRLLVAWGLWLAAAVVWIGSQARRRFEAERLAGRTIIRLVMFDERLPGLTSKSRYIDVIGAFLLALLGLSIVSIAAVHSPGAGAPVSTALLYASCGTASIGLLSQGVFKLWWRKTIRFCESGVLWDRTLLPWSHVISHRWSDFGGTLELRGSGQRGAEIKYELAVPWGSRDVVQRLLEANLSERPSAAGVQTGTNAASSSGRVESQRTRGKVVTFAGRIVMAVGIFYVFASGSQGTAEFYGMLIAGVVGGWLVHGVQGARISKRAGAPLVRLYARIDWWASLALLTVCVTCYFVGTSYSWTGPWLARVFGLGCGLAFILSILPTEFAYFELREGGVLYPGRFLWPWPSVRLLHWDRNGTGRLVLGRGWRRIVAHVPPEQRPAVDSALNQRLRPGADKSARV